MITTLPKSKNDDKSVMLTAFANIPRWFYLTILSVLVANRLIYYFFASPLPDEAYYWLWGQHPDLSYFDHPPLQAWFQAFNAWIFGTSLFALRLPAIFSTLVVVFTLVWWARKNNPSIRNAELLIFCIAALSSPLFFMFIGIVFNDHVLIALLSVASILVFIALDTMAQTGRVHKTALYTAALTIGLAGIAKYNAAVFALGVVVATACIPQFRALFRSPHLYLAGLLCLLCLTPVFLWNYTHQSASFQYNLHDRLGSASTIGKVPIRIIQFSVAAVLSLSPFLVLPLLRACRRQPDAEHWQENWRKIIVTIMTVAVIFFLGMTYFTYILYYWSIVAFIAILPFAILQFRSHRQLMAHMVYGATIVSIITFNFTILPVSALFGKPDFESGVVYGWPEITKTTNTLMLDQDADFNLTSDYRTASILAFWTKNKNVEVISKRRSQFTLWFNEDQHTGQDAIIVTSQWHPMSETILSRFESVELLTQKSILRLGYPIANYEFYFGRSYLPVVSIDQN